MAPAAKNESSYGAVLAIVLSTAALPASMPALALPDAAAVSAPTQPLARELRRHVEVLAGEIGERNLSRPQALHRAEEYIRSAWTAQGHRVHAHAYSVRSETCSNLEIAFPGTDLAAQIVLVGAHYDSAQGSPGANDNATGVAALLELGNCLAARAPRRTVKLVAFVNEEPPLFQTREMGSDVYARAAKARGDDIRAMISLESIGYYAGAPGTQRYPPLLGWFYPDRGNFIGFVSNLASRALLKRAVAAFRAASDFPVQWLAAPAFVPGVGWSDQLSFWSAGYRGIMITDTALYRDPHYHTAQDTPDKIDYARFAAVAQGVCRAVAALADAADL